MEAYIKDIKETTKGVKPNALSDFYYFRNLHSWYKHLPAEGNVAYVMLNRGRERKNALQEDDCDDGEYHWWIILDCEFEKRLKHSEWLKDMAKCHKIVLSNQMIGDEEINEYLEATDRFWELVNQ